MNSELNRDHFGRKSFRIVPKKKLTAFTPDGEPIEDDPTDTQSYQIRLAQYEKKFGPLLHQPPTDEPDAAAFNRLKMERHTFKEPEKVDIVIKPSFVALKSILDGPVKDDKHNSDFALTQLEQQINKIEASYKMNQDSTPVTSSIKLNRYGELENLLKPGISTETTPTTGYLRNESEELGEFRRGETTRNSTGNAVPNIRQRLIPIRGSTITRAASDAQDKPVPVIPKRLDLKYRMKVLLFYLFFIKFPS